MMEKHAVSPHPKKAAWPKDTSGKTADDSPRRTQGGVKKHHDEQMKDKGVLHDLREDQYAHKSKEKDDSLGVFPKLESGRFHFSPISSDPTIP
jgi:hypothetical protein